MYYPIGTANTPWGPTEKAEWLRRHKRVKRSYKPVIRSIEQLRKIFEVIQYCSVTYARKEYPLFALKSRQWSPELPSVLVTGGVHGYETSGVHGALLFASRVPEYSKQFNFIICPCVCPWGYETINRWNPSAVDPNRSFVANSQSEECAALMNFLASQRISFLAHFDLHESPESDRTEFLVATAARDGKEKPLIIVPDGFFCVGNRTQPQLEFYEAILSRVRKLTHVARVEVCGEIGGIKPVAESVVVVQARELGLCISATNAPFTVTTEINPDSKRISCAVCNEAQAISICGGLEFLARAGHRAASKL